MKVSILFNIIDHFELARECLLPAIANCGYYNYEVLACNNGSRSNWRTVTSFFLDIPHLAYQRHNAANEGNYQMLNQMLLRAKGPFYCIMDPDIVLPDGWLGDLVKTYYDLIDVDGFRPGVAGIHTVMGHDGPHKVGQHTILVKRNGIFGTKFFAHYVLKKVGYFVELSKYGFGDSNYGRRCNRAGMTNFYLDGKKGLHRGADVGEDSDYRRMKDAEMRKVGVGRRALWKAYGREYIYVPPPEHDGR